MSRRWQFYRYYVIMLLAFFMFSASGYETYAQDDYPRRPIKIIVPYGPGGGTDNFTRVIGAGIKKYLGQPLVIVNRSGAGGTVGTTEAAMAKPDGYTILSGYAAPMVQSPLTMKVRYSPFDFETIIRMSTTIQIVVAGPTCPANTWDKLVEYAKAHPGELKICVAGLNTGAHLFAEYAFSSVNISITPVPTTSVAESLAKTIGGHVHLAGGSAAITFDHIKKGTLKPILVSAPTPEVPSATTLADIGLKNLLTWRGIFAPKGTPNAIKNKLEIAFNKALNDQKVQKMLIDLGEPANPMAGKEFEKVMKEDYEIYKKIVEKLGITK